MKKSVNFSIKCARDSPGKGTICEGKLGNTEIRFSSLVKGTTTWSFRPTIFGRIIVLLNFGDGYEAKSYGNGGCPPFFVFIDDHTNIKKIFLRPCIDKKLHISWRIAICL